MRAPGARVPQPHHHRECVILASERKRLPPEAHPQKRRARRSTLQRARAARRRSHGAGAEVGGTDPRGRSLPRACARLGLFVRAVAEALDARDFETARQKRVGSIERLARNAAGRAHQRGVHRKLMPAAPWIRSVALPLLVSGAWHPSSTRGGANPSGGLAGRSDPCAAGAAGVRSVRALQLLQARHASGPAGSNCRFRRPQHLLTQRLDVLLEICVIRAWRPADAPSVPLRGTA